MDEKKPHAALLYGVTGSGKTSVILSLCEKAVSDGKSVIVLVPEIALTRQTVAVFVSRFGERAAVIHSGLSDGERFDAYKRIRRGDISVVLGTRSAIFAPLGNIGLIVIDEEQEYTYKSDMSPKYHARDVAKHRAAAHGALLLMASATPSVESFHEAETGKYTLVKLTRRYCGDALPAVKIADMRLASHGEDTEGYIGSTLRELLCETYENGMRIQQPALLPRLRRNAALSELLRFPDASQNKARFQARLPLLRIQHTGAAFLPEMRKRAPRVCRLRHTAHRRGNRGVPSGRKSAAHGRGYHQGTLLAG